MHNQIKEEHKLLLVSQLQIFLLITGFSSYK